VNLLKTSYEFFPTVWQSFATPKATITTHNMPPEYFTLKYPKYYLSKIFLLKLIPLKLIGPSKVRVTSGANLGGHYFRYYHFSLFSFLNLLLKFQKGLS
jgi:hypothetical protein